MKKSLSICAAAVISSVLLFLSCGKAIDNAVKFKPNRGPVIESVTQSMAADGSAVDMTKVISGLNIRIQVKGHDPEGKTLLWVVDSDCGSVKNGQATPDGYSFVFVTSGVSADKDVKVNITVTDEKKASVSFSHNVGTGKTGAILSLDLTGNPVISAGGTTSLALKSSSAGYYEIYCNNTITSVTQMQSRTRISYDAEIPGADADGKFLPLALSAQGHLSTAAADVRLPGAGANTVWVAFIDDNRNVSSASCVVTVDNSGPAVSAHSPEDGAISVSPNPTVSLTFSEAIDVSTLAGALVVTEGTNTYASALVSSTSTGATYSVATLPQTTVCTAAVSGVTDVYGNVMIPSSFTFTTSAGPVVSYYPNFPGTATGGVCPAAASYSIDEDVSVAGNTGSLSAAGYTFSGWNTSADGSGTAYAAGAVFTMAENDVSLYAQWAKIPVTGVALNKTTTSMLIDATETLAATVSPSEALDSSVIWASSNPLVAAVSDIGKVTAVGAGSATITVTTTDGAQTAVCAVTVSAATIPVTGVTLSVPADKLYVGSTITLVATVSPSNATNQNLQWTSASSQVLTVNNGVVTGKSLGSARVTVTTVDRGYSAYTSVNVTSNDALLANITVSAGVLYPVFSSSVVSYLDAPVPYAATSSKITATLSYSKASMTINGAAAVSGEAVTISGLAVGPNPIPIVVTALDGVTTKTYTVNMYRAVPVYKTGAGVISDYIFRSGEDGDAQRGVAWIEPRFTVNKTATGIVDNNTGLLWYKSPQNTKAVWADFFALVYGLAIDGNTCRVPNIRELRSLIHYGKADTKSWLYDQDFPALYNAKYWSSTSYPSGTTLTAWTEASTVGDQTSVAKTSLLYVLPVCGTSARLQSTGVTRSQARYDDGYYKAGVPLPSTRYRENKKGVITDNMTGLSWLKNGNISSGELSWTAAFTYVVGLNNGTNSGNCGYTDWRLPTVNELESILNYSKITPYASLNTYGFGTGSVQNGLYWTSTTYASNTLSAWAVNMGTGGLDSAVKTSGCFILPVRFAR